jgi:hypothetical protein
MISWTLASIGAYFLEMSMTWPPWPCSPPHALDRHCVGGATRLAPPLTAVVGPHLLLLCLVFVIEIVEEVVDVRVVGR